MNFHILTLFPDMVEQGLHTSILGRAAEKELLSIDAVDIRDYTINKHKKVDDYPYGGGAGMVMQAQPVYDAWRSVVDRIGYKPRTIYLTPQGPTFTQTMAKEYAVEEDLILLCGHYEGIDERVLEEIVTDYISIGDYVLTGGELAAMVLTDAISRMVPGVLSNQESGSTESFEGSLLEYPQYSRPEVWNEKSVPAILLSGDHAKVDAWRREQSILRTIERRPDLMEQAELTAKERAYYVLDKKETK
jgi:tRNA (guanine37-N1)-methyltransferase